MVITMNKTISGPESGLLLIIFKPLHKPGYPGVQGHVDGESHGRFNGAGVGKGFLHIAGLHGEQLFNGTLVKGIFHFGNEVEKPYGGRVPDVEDPVMGMWLSLAGDVIHHLHHALPEFDASLFELHCK